MWNKTHKFAYILVPLLAMGCKPNESELKSYKATIITASGSIYKEKVIYSTSLPSIHQGVSDNTFMYFDWDGQSWRQNQLPAGWFVEIEPMSEHE